MMEFHVSRETRDKYQFDKTLFSYTGNVVFANLAASREFAHRMNVVRQVEEDPSRAVRPAALYAMGLIDELSHAVVEYYRRQLDPPVLAEALAWLESRMGRAALDETLLAFVEHFPSSAVYLNPQQGRHVSLRWLQGATDGVEHRAIALEELLLLWLANVNPAFDPFLELFADAPLAAASGYREMIPQLRAFFKTRPLIGKNGLDLIGLLRAPALASPGSLQGQLDFIRRNWVEVLGAALDRLILAIDILREEDLAIWAQFHPPSRSAGQGAKAGGGADSSVPSFAGTAGEQERFSPDQDWMPSTVLLAKSTFVWLEQLSRKYRQNIHRLDQIPDEELDLMARRGLNSLWLIGVWERSTASQTIKQLCGNLDAVASAYSLYGYSIAADLGGEEAYRNLRDRAFAYGIRLASDMVPNHMGIDSSWVIEHPEWFLSRPDSPYAAYRFDGPDLSRDDRVEIKIEDHYYEQSDAAVVFRRRDRWTGDIRYVYHGNDGTSFPWNDTAQIDYLNPAAREQVIQTILQVARLFPIIRFDAAMTLAKRHIERLWYPLPGSSGAIPSRAEYSMSKADFDAAIPEEFWREVVDRVAREVPGTLLLAEAFWLMEGYFVRTLGMHRVYNSAFMNMLRDEENAKYRSVIKNTLEFDPDILKRYVNFMSNPDERTAIDQFGKEDKYFGVATLLATLPGLPMFGHGQVEGFTEKYGMEFRKPRYEETPDPWMVERHDREIAPLLHRRWLFAESREFLLYDFYRSDGSVDENVFAYSNRRGDQRALVIYHNRFATTHGTIHHSAAYADKSSGQQRQRSLGDAFSLPSDSGAIVAFRDAASGLEHLERSAKLQSNGLSLELHAYKRHVFLDWRELRPEENRRWDLLCDHLGGRGVPNVEEALLSLELAPVHDALVSLLRPELLRSMASLSNDGIPINICRERAPNELAGAFFHDLERYGMRFFQEAARFYMRRGIGKSSVQVDPEQLWTRLCELVRAAIRIPLLEARFTTAWSTQARDVLPSLSPHVPANTTWAPVLAWCAIEAFVLGYQQNAIADSQKGLEAFDQLRLREPLARAFRKAGFSEEESWRAAARIRIAFLAGADAAKPVAGYSTALWGDPDVRWLIDLHAAGKKGSEAHYFNQEQHEELLWWIQLPVLIRLAAVETPAKERPLASAVAAPPASSATSAQVAEPSPIPVNAAPTRDVQKTTRPKSKKATERDSPNGAKLPPVADPSNAASTTAVAISSIGTLERQIQTALAQSREAGFRLEELRQPKSTDLLPRPIPTE